MATLVRHDGISEVFVCKSCMVQVDPVGGNYPDWTKDEADNGVCPHCGGTDTKWLFAESKESFPKEGEGE